VDPKVKDFERPIVEMRGIVKTFGSTRALRSVDFTLMEGEIHALLGRNGAGKSTLVSALSGFTPADAGTLRIANTEVVAGGSDYTARIRGDIAHVQQTPQLFNLLTVAENLFIENAAVRNKYGMVSHKLMAECTAKLMSDWSMDIDPGALAGELGAGSRQLLEIMKALSRGVPVIILDEPTASLSNNEKRILFQHVKTLRRAGVSFVYISHHLDEVFEVADVVTILRDGYVVKERLPVEGLDTPTLANLMMGEKTVRSIRSDYTIQDAPPLLLAKGIRLSDSSSEAINFEVRPGEIVAFAGPVGGGKEKFAMVLAGQEKPFAGQIVSARENEPVIGFVPTDRHTCGYVGILSVRENVALGGLDVLSDKFGFLSKDKEMNLIGRLVSQTNVIASSVNQAVSQLSGGNQQKVVFARALCRDPEIVVALSPTRGVDVGAKEQLYALLRDLARKGLGVVVVSDEEFEISQLASRVVIFFEDRVVDEMAGDYRMEDLVLHMEGAT
jgi:ABC-type sugar transport system ATPase subunit